MDRHEHLEQAFTLAQRNYPSSIHLGKQTYRLVSAREASGFDDWGETLILQEDRGTRRYPINNHWGFRVEPAHIEKKVG